MLPRHTGTCTTGKTVDFLGRRITNKGDHFLKSHSTAVRPTTYYKKPTYSKQHLQLHQEQQLQHLHLHKMSYSTSKNTDENWAGCDPTLGYNSALWIPYTSSRSTLISREWVLRHWYRSNRSITPQEFPWRTLTNKINLKMHTDSSPGKSMATRIGVPKKAKHIELRYMFIQHLIHDGFLAIHKINTKRNPADILAKYVTREVLQWHLCQVGIRPPESWGEIQLQQFHHGSWGERQLQSFHWIAEGLHSYRSFTYQHTNTHVWIHACSMQSWHIHVSRPQGVHVHSSPLSVSPRHLSHGV